jgi:hypothetical protein
MRDSRWMAAALLAGLVSSSAVLAAPRTGRGNQELAVHVSLDFEGAVGDTISADAGWGWFVRDGLLLRGLLSYAILEDVAAQDSDYRTRELAVASEYHFRRARSLVPYVGLGVGWRSTEFADLTRSGMVYGPRAGVKYFLADNVALDFEVAYRFAGDDVFVNDFVVEDTDLGSAIGLRVYF